MKALREFCQKLGARFSSVLYSEEGQGLVEYALILVLIALIVIAMLRGVGLSVNDVYCKINSGLQ